NPPPGRAHPDAGPAAAPPPPPRPDQRPRPGRPRRDTEADPANRHRVRHRGDRRLAPAGRDRAGLRPPGGDRGRQAPAVGPARLVHGADGDARRRGRGRSRRSGRAAHGGWAPDDHRRVGGPDRPPGRAAVRPRPRHRRGARPAPRPDRAAPSSSRGPVPRRPRARGRDSFAADGRRATMSETAGPARAGSIYDLGYRRYEGVRLGRGAAIRALAADSFRTTYGIGHGGRAKVAPIILVGRVLLSTDVAGAFADDLPTLPAVVAQALVIAGVFGGLAMAVSAFTPRRAYATAGIVALFILPGIIAQIVIGLGSGGIGTWLVLLSPGFILDGTGAFLFGKELPGQLFFFDLPAWTFLASAAVVTAVAVGLVVRRFVRIAV